MLEALVPGIREGNRIDDELKRCVACQWQTMSMRAVRDFPIHIDTGIATALDEIDPQRCQRVDHPPCGRYIGHHHAIDLGSGGLWLRGRLQDTRPGGRALELRSSGQDSRSYHIPPRDLNSKSTNRLELTAHVTYPSHAAPP